MLNIDRIIDILTTQQKVEIVTDISALKKYGSEIGLNVFPFGSFVKHDLRSNSYPDFVSLACSWNPGLLSAIATDRATNNMSPSNILFIPDAKPIISSRLTGLCEDTISGIFVNAIANGVLQSRKIPFISCRGIEKYELPYLDESPNSNLIYNCYLKPYIYSWMKIENPMIYEHLDGSIGDKYIAQESEIFKNNYPEDAYIFVAALPGKTVSSLLDGKILVSGHKQEVVDALQKYTEMQKRGTDMSLISQEVNAGNAMSVDMLNKYLARVLSLVNACAPQSTTPSQRVYSDKLLSAATHDSIVLLKNENNILPFANVKKVAVIGASGKAYAEQFSENVIGFSEGDPEKTDNNGIDTAVKLAGEADKVLVFLNGTYNDKCLLPATQLAMLKKLEQYGNKTVLVVSADFSLDMSFDKAFDGVLWVPTSGSTLNFAINNIITGAYNPVGRLPYTLFDNTKAYFDGINESKYSYQKKIGVFVGYRYYDNENIPVKYPFGHGLSYSTFAYSKVKESNGSISFTIKNTSDVDGTAVVQIYAEKQDNEERLFPKRELVYFTRIFLKAGKSVNHVANIDEIKKFNSKGVLSGDKGEYTFYVSSSLTEVKGTCSKNINGSGVKIDKSLSDEDTYSVNVNPDFRFNCPVKQTKKNKASIIVSAIMAAVCLIAGVLIAAVSNLSGTILLAALLVVGIGLVGSIIFLLYWLKVSKQSKNKENYVPKEGEKLNIAEVSALFKEAKTISDNYDAVDEIIEEQKPDYTFKPGSIQSGKISKDYTFSVMGQKLHEYFTQGGLDMSKQNVMAIVAAIASSKLIIFSGRESVYDRVMDLLTNFFSSQRFMSTSKGATSINDTTNAFNEALAFAEKNTEKVVFAEFKRPDMRRGSMLNNIINMENSLCSTQTYFSGRKGTEIQNNLWTVFYLDRGALTQKIANVASVIILDCNIVSENNAPHTAGIEKTQIFFMRDYGIDDYALPEPYWKKMDESTAMINRMIPFSLDNKNIRRLEAFSAILSSSKLFEVSDVFDYTMSALYVPIAFSNINAYEVGEITMDDVIAKIGEKADNDMSKKVYAYLQRMSETGADYE